MDWDAIGAIGEVVGATGVVLTLVYLAVQIKQNSIQLKENSRASVLASFDQTVSAFSRQRHMMSEAGTSEFFELGLESYEELSPAEKRRFRAIFEEYIFPLVTIFERQKAGGAELDYFDLVNQGTLLADLSRPGGKQYWEDRKSLFPPDFAATVDRHLESNEFS